MAEAIATVGAISSVLQIVSFTSTIVEYITQILREKQAAPIDNAATERLVEEYRELHERVLTSLSGNQPSPEEAAVLRQQREYHAEAEELLNKLKALKVDPNVTGLQRMQHATKKAFLAVKQREDIEKHRIRLVELNGALSTSLLQLLLSRHAKQMQLVESLNDKWRTMRDEEKVIQVQSGLDSVYRHIVASLEYNSIADRYTSIEMNFPRTYQWAVESDAYGLKSWLRNGSGIFWISGKAGAGKSTLMKFLISNLEAHQLLQSWGGEDVVVASFYSWFLGQTEQKTLRGLLRTILWELIRKIPDYGPVAFPDLYKALVPPASKQTWTDEDLQQAFERVCSYTTRPTCLFIDGLDEFAGNQTSLIKLLRSVSQNANIKLCLSSRPWNAFRTAFETKVPHIKLEELTYQDMLLYTRSSIRQECLELEIDVSEDGSKIAPTRCDNPWKSPLMRASEVHYVTELSNISDLAQSIADRAEGVFLWVKLVVRSVISGLAEGDPIFMLQERVKMFPTDLGQFFETILSRVDNVYAKQTAQALKLACFTVEGEDPEHPSHGFMTYSSWIDYWLISRDAGGLHNAEFALKRSPVIKIEDEIRAMIKQTRTFLSAACKDLLWLPKESRSSVPWSKVVFLHRTVYEFLVEHMHIYRAKLDRDLPVIFREGRVQHLLNLARLKFVHEGEDMDFRRSLARASMTLSLAQNRPHPDLTPEYNHDFDNTLVFYIEKLDESPPALQTPDIPSRNKAFFDLEHVKDLNFFLSKGLQKSARAIVAQFMTGRDPWFRQYSVLKNVAVAVLGDDRTCAIEDIDPIMLEMLLDHPLIVPNMGFYWSQVLRSWRRAERTRQTYNLEKAWEVAKVFLRKGASIHQPIQASKSSTAEPETAPKSVDANQFISARVPQEWIDDAGFSSLVGKRDEKSGRCSRQTMERPA